MNAIEVLNLTKEYSGRLVLKEISFCIKKGLVHGFLGPNGAGKTTTMKIIAGLLEKSSGDVKIFDKSCDFFTWQQRCQFGILAEVPSLYNSLSVEHFLSFMAQIRNISSKDIKQRLDECVELCDLKEFRSRLICNLSKGMKQRVAIASTLMHRPKILIWDEPMSGLDPLSILKIRELVEYLKGEHTILFSTHQLHDVESLCQEATIIHAGEVLKTGKIGEIKNSLSTTKKYKVSFATQVDHNTLDKVLNELNLTRVCQAKTESDCELVIESSQSIDIRNVLIKKLIEANLEIVSILEVENDLESIFKNLISKKEL